MKRTTTGYAHYASTALSGREPAVSDRVRRLGQAFLQAQWTVFKGPGLAPAETAWVHPLQGLLSPARTA